MITRLGPFQILEEVGRGGMGTVYRGLDPIIGRPVAVKVIRLVGYTDSEEQLWMRGRLFREARAAGRLCHSGIVTIYQVGEEEDVAYIAMEFVDGPTLKQLLEPGRNVSQEELCRILMEAAAALDYAHERGLVHRDIKPENIMVTGAGVTKVTDFGIAKTMLGQTATRTDGMAGTPLFMSPEQIRGQELDGRSDQFALAVIAYRIFTGRFPFEAEHVTSVCYQIIHEEPPAPEDLVPGIGPEITAVINRGLSKEAANRFPTCTEFATALDAAYRKRPHACEIKARPETAAKAGRTVWQAAMGFVLALVLLGAAAAFTRRPAVIPTPVQPQTAPVARVKGHLVWTGVARQGDLVTISATQASIGSVAGALPGVPVRIRLYPAEQTPHGLSVFLSDSPEPPPEILTPLGPATFVFDPRHATDLTVFDAPAPNQWERLRVHVNANVSAFLVEWESDNGHG
jgi:tRNA A-37 threonylcarbamoyl transferase component Bud32